jgi:hypothetical protein
MSMKVFGFTILFYRRDAETRRKKSSRVAQFFDDGARKVFLYFAVAWNRLAHFRAGILIPIVLAAVPDKHAAHSREFLNECDALHAT